MGLFAVFNFKFFKRNLALPIENDKNLDLMNKSFYAIDLNPIRSIK